MIIEIFYINIHRYQNVFVGSENTSNILYCLQKIKHFIFSVIHRY